MKYKSIALTHPGKTRANNEDSCYKNSRTNTYAVCDGMGGESYGEIGSSIAVDTIRELDKGEITEHFDDIVEIASKLIDDKCQELGCRTIGTTLTLLAIDDDTATIANIGDSRIYLFRDGSLEQLTEDHTMVYQMYLNGAMSKEDARHHKRAHILYQHLGMNKEEGLPRPSVKTDIKVKKGDLFVLCSDGLTDMLSDEEIEEILKMESDIEKTARKLMDAALDAGGKDNITIIVVEAARERLFKWK